MGWFLYDRDLCHERVKFQILRLFLSKEFLDIQATTECGFTLKRVRDMIKTQPEFNSTLICGSMYF